MNALSRTLAGLVVGATVVAGAGVACATPHTVDGYISEIRDTMADYDNRSTSDDQIVNVGRAMCSAPEALDTSRISESDATPQQQETTIKFSAVTSRYCDVLGTTGNGFGPAATSSTTAMPAAGTDPVPAPPSVPTEVPVTIGQPLKINYGGDDVYTVTITKVGRCSSSLKLDITAVTGQAFQPGSDAIAQSVDWIGTDGVTHTGSGLGMPSTMDCYDSSRSFPSPYDLRPGRTYTGEIFYDIPKGQGAKLNLYGSDGVTRVLAILGK